MIKQTYDTNTPDVWLRSIDQRWGRYLTDIEFTAVRRGIEILDRPAGTALDIGAEAGRLTGLLIDEGFQVTCTEICPKKVERCQELNPSSTCKLVSVEDSSLPVADNSTDLAISIEVPVSEADWFLPEMNRILTDEGSVVFSINNKLSYRGVLTNLRSRLTGDEVHYWKSFNQVRNDVLKHGFTIDQVAGYCWPPFARLSNSPMIPFLTSCEKWLQLRRLPSVSPWVILVCKRAKRNANNG